MTTPLLTSPRLIERTTEGPLRTAWRGHRVLVLMAGLMSLYTIVSLIGLVADDRVLLGQPIWLKPFKFGVSFIVYGFSLAWLMAYLQKGRKVATWAGHLIVLVSLAENAIILLQVVRGRASHFNEATPLDAALWAAMGNLIVILWLSTLVIAILVWRQGMPDHSLTWAIRLGLVLMLVGFAQGMLMAAMQNTPPGTAGAHSVGVSDGGPGMALTGWSTTGGDLRIGHFVGIHALQALVLLAMVLPKFVADTVRRTRLVLVFGGFYFGLFILVTWQALRGQPLTSPDSTTLTAFGLLTAVSAAAAAFSLRRSH